MKNNWKNKKHNQSGITLITLVITMIIILILSTVTITTVVGDDGLIAQAKLTQQTAANSVDGEAGRMNKILQEYTNMMQYDGSIAGPDDPGTEPGDPDDPDEDPDAPYVDDALPMAPTVGKGMIPVKYDAALGWVRTTEQDPDWYNYDERRWANVVLSEAQWTTNGSNQVLNEGFPYTMLVWIPRYAYQITSKYHQGGTDGGTINVKFVDTNNQTKDKSETIGTAYPAYNTSSGMAQYVVHPAFTYGDTNGTKTELAGFWVGKFETSSQNCTTDESTGTYDGTGRAIMIKGNVTSWRSISVNNIFRVCEGMNNSTDNIYGLDVDSKVDPHMMKNTEWGAVAYLAQNATYGKGNEVSINDNSSYLTGGGNYKSNLGQSTNENITGVYDMSGGAWEYVAAYAKSGNSNGSALTSAASRYKDVYSSYDYNTATLPQSQFGDAVYETSGSGSGTNSWYSDSSNFPISTDPFFRRGGYYDGGAGAGVFSFNGFAGRAGSHSSFRLVVPVLSV